MFSTFRQKGVGGGCITSVNAETNNINKGDCGSGQKSSWSPIFLNELGYAVQQACHLPLRHLFVQFARRQPSRAETKVTNSGEE